MEPVALRRWEWQDDITANLRHDLRHCKFMRLSAGDPVWPLNPTGPQPAPRIEGNTWQYGQNLTRAKQGWYPAEHVIRPPDRMIHEAQRQRTDNHIQSPPGETQPDECDHDVPTPMGTEPHESPAETDEEQENLTSS